MKKQTVKSKRQRAARKVEPLVRRCRTGFGMALIPKIPDDCDVVIVCVNNFGLHPKLLLLPHQLYERTARELFKEAGGPMPQLTVIPARSKDYVDVWPLKTANIKGQTQRPAGEKP